MLTGVERAAEDGDFVSIDLEAKLDGEVLEDGSTTGMSYEVGSGKLMEGLDDAVRGLSADESKTFTTALLSGPNAGETAEVTVTVRSVKTKELPGARRRVRLDRERVRHPRRAARRRPHPAGPHQDAAAGRAGPRQAGRAPARGRRGARCPRTWSSARSSGATGPSSRSCSRPAWTGTRFLSISGGESREAYDAEQRKNVEEAVRTQFILDAIADAREVTVDNDDLSAQIMAQAQRSRMSPEQYAQQLQQGGNIAEFVADVRRTKTLAQLLEQTTITDASGNVVDLEALRPQTRPGAGRRRADEADRRGRRRGRRPRPTEDDAEGLTAASARRRRRPARPGWGGVVVSGHVRCAVGEHRPDGDCVVGGPR